MLKMRRLSIPEYEHVIEALDSTCGLHAFVSVHSTALGPSLGGVRMYPYHTPEEALEDALRLSKAMTFKSALAETGLGGGKSVIIGDPKKIKTEKLLFCFAEVINSLKGTYIAAEDVGTNEKDMFILHKKTPYVTALPIPESSGDPSRFTAFGVLQGIKACAQFLWNSKDLTGRTVAIQGLGSVGAKLAQHLFWEGAELILTDLDKEKMQEAARAYGAKTVLSEEIYDQTCDIFAPCALGGILYPETIHRFNCLAIAGSANNQLRAREDGLLLLQRNILHAPGYVINAGGIINVSCEFDPAGYNPRVARSKILPIYETLLTIFKKAREKGIPPSAVADEMALYRLHHLIGKRVHPIHF